MEPVWSLRERSPPPPDRSRDEQHGSGNKLVLYRTSNQWRAAQGSLFGDTEFMSLWKTLKKDLGEGGLLSEKMSVIKV